MTQTNGQSETHGAGVARPAVEGMYASSHISILNTAKVPGRMVRLDCNVTADVLVL